MTPSQESSGGYVAFQGCVRRDGKPFVKVTIDDDDFGQLTPAEALNMGIRAIQASIEAERDAATILGLKSAGMDEQSRAAFLVMVREHRGQVDPDPRDDHQPPEDR